jgi:hypothetical protein
MQLLHVLCCFDLVSDIPLPTATLGRDRLATINVYIIDTETGGTTIDIQKRDWKFNLSYVSGFGLDGSR